MWSNCKNTKIYYFKEAIFYEPNFSKSRLRKQNRIINAALQEFAENGFEKASTNRIVKTAKLAKACSFTTFKIRRSSFTI